MQDSSSLSEEHREAAVALFEIGWGAKSAATRLGVRSKAVIRIHNLWRVRGGTALVTKRTKRKFSFEFKLDAVRRFQAGESQVALAKELELSSPDLIKKWARIYRIEGEDGLRPKPLGRPMPPPEAPAQPESELQRLRRENERLRAEVASCSARIHPLVQHRKNLHQAQRPKSSDTVLRPSPRRKWQTNKSLCVVGAGSRASGESWRFFLVLGRSSPAHVSEIAAEFLSQCPQIFAAWRLI